MAQIPPPDQPPAIPPIVRTYAYFTALVAGGLGSMATGITAVVAPDSASTVAGIVGAVTGGILFITGGLGVAYRPTASSR